MRKQNHCSMYQDYFEYHGNTEIKRTRKRAGSVVANDWLVFDSVDDAMEYFNTRCEEFTVPNIPVWMIEDVASY